jgi:hypothetical protein
VGRVERRGEHLHANGHVDAKSILKLIFTRIWIGAGADASSANPSATAPRTRRSTAAEGAKTGAK